MVSDGSVPYDVIVRACQRYAENGIPSAPKGTATVTPVLPKKDPELEEEVPMESNTIQVKEEPKETKPEEPEDIKAVETPQPTNLDSEQSARFTELNSKYESNGGSDMNTEELSEYFTLRIKGGVN